MWIVKLGGSLNQDPLLPQWLELLGQLGGGRVTMVCGGGEFAEQVRRSQGHWRFHELAAHNMALLAMVQSAYMMHALNPALQLVHADADIRRVLHQGQTALWTPLGLLAEHADADTNWDVTADSIALVLARRLNAERVVLVKSCEVDPGLSLDELGAAGVVDRRFAQLGKAAAFPIDFVCRDEIERMRGLLLAGSGPALGEPHLARRRL